MQHDILAAARAGDLTKVKKLTENGPDVIKSRGSQGQTVLAVAAGSGNAELVNYLLQHGADVHAKDDSNSSAIHWACRGGEERKSPLQQWHVQATEQRQDP